MKKTFFALTLIFVSLVSCKKEQNDQPTSPSYFYNLGINPVNGDIFVTDALDYQQRRRLLIFNNKGELLSEMFAGISPGRLYFTQH